MRINEVVSYAERDPNKNYSKLDKMRSLHRSPDPESDADVNPDDSEYLGANHKQHAVGVMKGIKMAAQSKSGSQNVKSATVANTNSSKQVNRSPDNWDKMADLFSPKFRERGIEFLDKFKSQSENPGTRAVPSDTAYIPIPIIYKGKTPFAALTTTNNITMSLDIGKKAMSDSGKIVIGIPRSVQKIQKDAVEDLKNALKDAGYEPSEPKDLRIPISPQSREVDGILKEFWSITNLIEELGEDFKSEPTSSRAGNDGPGERKMTNLKYYLGAAEIIYVASRYGMKHLRSRGGKGDKDGGGTFDINDNLISKAFSKAGYDLLINAKQQIQSGETPTRPYREHAVPSDYIQKLGTQMYKDGKSKEEVADMIRRNLIIVWISREEANRMDNEMQLKTTMPAGWKDGDSPFARFKAAKISVYSATDGKRLAEDND